MLTLWFYFIAVFINLSPAISTTTLQLRFPMAIQLKHVFNC